MKYTAIVKSALAVVLGFAVGAASADEVKFSDDFQSYEVGTTLSTIAADANAKWQSAGEDDTSAIVAEGENKLLNLNTEGGIVSNKFASAEDVAALNAAIAGDGIALDTKIQFVPSDDDKTIPEGNDLKFALFAFADEEAVEPYTNLVVTHSIMRESGSIDKINTITDVKIKCDKLTAVKVEMKKFVCNSEQAIRQPIAFRVLVDDVVVTSANAYTAEALSVDYNGKAGGEDACWFLVASLNEAADADRAQISALALQGTGKVDDVAISTIVSIPDFFVVDGVSYKEAQAEAAFAAANEGKVIKFIANYTLAADISGASNTLIGEMVTLTIADGGKIRMDIGEYDDLNDYIDGEMENPLVGEAGAKVIAGGYTWTSDGETWTRPQPTVVIITDAGTQEIFDLANLNAAIASAADGATIKLNADCAAPSTVVVPAGKTLVLDLNGHTLVNTVKGYTLDNQGNLTIIDSSEDKTGVIDHIATDTASTVRNLGSLTLNDVAVTGNYIGIKNDEGVGCNGGKGYGELVINGGTYAGGDPAAGHQAVQNWGKATINGGTFNSCVCSWAYNGNEGNIAGELVINGGDFNAAVVALNYDAEPAESAKVTIKGGKFDGDVYSAFGGNIDIPAKVVVDDVEVFNPAKFKDASYVAVADEGYEFVLDEDGYYVVQEAAPPAEPLAVLIAAGEDDVEFTDLNAALVAGKDAGKTVKLIRDVDLAGVEWVPVADFKGTFDGDGYTISNFSFATDSTSTAGLGLIGNANDPAVIKNIKMVNVTVSAPNAEKVGTVVGNLWSGALVTNISVSGTIKVAGKKYVGGVYGYGYGTAVDAHVDGGSAATSSITAITTAEGQVGGILGFYGEGAVSIQDCTVKNVTIAGTERAGGVAGRMHTGARMINCSAENVVVKAASLNEIGALAGTKVSGAPAWVINCSATNVVLQDLDGNELPFTLLANNFATNGAITGTDAVGLNLYVGASKYNFTAGTFTLTAASLLSNLEGQIADEYQAVQQGDTLTYVVQAVPQGPTWPASWTEGKGTEGNLAALDTWMKANGLADADLTAALEGNFLMGAPATADVSTGLKITSIAAGDVIVVEVESNVEGVALSDAMPGVVVLKGANDLEGTWTVIDELEVVDGVATFNGTTTYKFFKAYIDYPAPEAE